MSPIELTAFRLGLWPNWDNLGSLTRKWIDSFLIWFIDLNKISVFSVLSFWAVKTMRDRVGL